MDRSDLTGAVTQTHRRGKKNLKRQREGVTDIDLEVVVELLPSSGEVQPNFGVAQDREEAGPCNQTQSGKFLEDKRAIKMGFYLKVKGG